MRNMGSFRSYVFFISIVVDRTPFGPVPWCLHGSNFQMVERIYFIRLQRVSDEEANRAVCFGSFVWK